MLLLNTTLGGLDGTIKPPMLHHLALLHAETLHDASELLRTEKPHKIVFKRDEELRGTRIALTRTAPAQLAVDTTRLVTFGTNHMKTAKFGNPLAQLDIGTAPCHIRRNRNRPTLTRQRHNLGLPCMILGIQDFMWNMRHLKHAGKYFRGIDRNRTEQYRLALRVTRSNISDNRLILLSLRPIDLVIIVNSINRLVRRYRNNVELVD